MSLYQQYLASCLQCGLPAMSADTAARILAIVHLCANNENFTHNAKLRADLEYICKRWHIEGGASVSSEIHPLIRQYSKEIDRFIAEHPRDWGKHEKEQEIYPKWCEDLIFGRYGFHLYQ